MHLGKDNRGFIFSLDATLAVLVALIALAGVASIGNSLNTSEHFGRLRLQRVGQDAIRVLNMKGTFENAILAMEAAEYNRAERIIRENLKKALPDHIQFRFYIRNQLSVYPTDNSEWENLYENIEDRTVTNFLSKVPARENYFRVLAWTPEPREENFVDSIQGMRPLWYIKKTTNIDNFRENVEKEDEDGKPFEFYDAVFIPDADIQFSPGTIQSLKVFAEHGRLVVAGDTLYKNQDTLNFSRTFGIYNWDYDPGGVDIIRWDRGSLESEIESRTDPDYFRELKMYAQPVHAEVNLDHPILYGFTPIDNLAYKGEHVYTYDDFLDRNFVSPIHDEEYHDPYQNDVDYDISTAKVLTNWGHYPEDQALDLSGLIVNERNGWTGVAVFIGANVVQTVNRNASSYKWLRLTANSISGEKGYQLFHEPITLSLWKGEGI